MKNIVFENTCGKDCLSPQRVRKFLGLATPSGRLAAANGSEKLSP